MRWKNKGLVFLAMVFVVVYLCQNLTARSQALGINAGHMGSYLFYVFFGSREYVPGKQAFEVNPAFMCIHILMAWVLSRMTASEYKKRDYQILIRVGSVKKLWYEKCIHAVKILTAFYMVIILTVIVYAGNVNIFPEKGLNDILEVKIITYQSAELFVYFFVVPFLTSLMLAFVQMGISMIFSAVYGFLGIVFIQLLSAFVSSKWIPGNYLMMARMLCECKEKITLYPALLVDMSVSLVVIFLVAVILERRDIL